MRENFQFLRPQPRKLLLPKIVQNECNKFFKNSQKVLFHNISLHQRTKFKNFIHSKTYLENILENNTRNRKSDLQKNQIFSNGRRRFEKECTIYFLYPIKKKTLKY